MIQVDELVIALDRFDCVVCVDEDDDTAALSDCCFFTDDEDVMELLSTLCFLFFFCFLAGPSNNATSALSVPVGGGGCLIPLSRALRR